jgi:hypothetical protein
MRRKLGRPRVDSEDVHVRLTRPALDILDAYIAAQAEPRPRALKLSASPCAIGSRLNLRRAARA